VNAYSTSAKTDAVVLVPPTRFPSLRRCPVCPPTARRSVRPQCPPGGVQAGPVRPPTTRRARVSPRPLPPHRQPDLPHDRHEARISAHGVPRPVDVQEDEARRPLLQAASRPQARAPLSPAIAASAPCRAAIRTRGAPAPRPPRACARDAQLHRVVVRRGGCARERVRTVLSRRQARTPCGGSRSRGPPLRGCGKIPRGRTTHADLGLGVDRPGRADRLGEPARLHAVVARRHREHEGAGIERAPPPPVWTIASFGPCPLATEEREGSQLPDRWTRAGEQLAELSLGGRRRPSRRTARRHASAARAAVRSGPAPAARRGPSSERAHASAGGTKPRSPSPRTCRPRRMSLGERRVLRGRGVIGPTPPVPASVSCSDANPLEGKQVVRLGSSPFPFSRRPLVRVGDREMQAGRDVRCDLRWSRTRSSNGRRTGSPEAPRPSSRPRLPPKVQSPAALTHGSRHGRRPRRASVRPPGAPLSP